MKNLPSSISLDGISFELLWKNETFSGLGEVKAGNDLLRSGGRPMFVEIRNPSGIELSNYRLADLKQIPEKTVLRFSMDRREGGLMEWMVHEIRARYNTANWAQDPWPADDTSLELELRPVRRTLGGRDYVGFSYQYHYRSGSIPIYKILDRGTWEPGGSIIEGEFWMRNCFVPPVPRFKSADQFFSTEWYIPDCLNPNAFQFAPLQTELQGFTFTPCERGTIATWATDVAHVRSLFEKPRGEEVMVHLHEHCGDLANEFSTSPIEVLWAPGARTAVEHMNDYEAVRELVFATLHTKSGLQRERISTYAQIEEWTPANLDRYRRLGVPKLLAAGITRIYLANHFENHMNTWGISNFCCNVDYKVAESVGEDKLRALCDDAKAGGAIVEMWTNTAISNLTVMFDDRREGEEGRIRFLPKKDSIMEAIDKNKSFVRNPSNAIEADHYTPLFAVLNLRDPKVRAYWLRRWREAHDRIGIQGFFLDSSFNMSSDKFHYVQNIESEFSGATADQTGLLGNFRPAKEPPAAILTQYPAHLEIIAEMQKMGISYCNEDLGVFGIHRHGPSIKQRLGNLFLWAECVVEFDPVAIREAGYDPGDVFIRGLAYRQMWNLHWNIDGDYLTFRYTGARDDGDKPTAWHLDILRAFTAVQETMVDRTILPDEAGVLYRSGDNWVLWAFGDMEIPVSGACIDVVTGKTVADKARVKRGVYLSSKS